MRRTTIYAIAGIGLVVAGTLYWRYRSHEQDLERQREITAIVDRTAGRPLDRIAALDSMMNAHPGDRWVLRRATLDAIRAHVEAGSDAATLSRAANAFLAQDSSGSASYYVASVYADRGINVGDGLRLANRALAELGGMEKPRGASDFRWAEQRRTMIGECLRVRGKLLAHGGRHAEAVTALRAAADSLVETPAALADLAGVYEKAGRRAEALATQMDIVRMRYDDAPAREAVARLYPEIHGSAVPVETVLDTLVANARARRKATVLADTTSREMPGFRLPGLAGETHVSDSLRGRIVVLEIWTTYCVPCAEQMRLFQRAYERYRRAPDVAFLAISVDDAKDLVAPYVAREEFTFPVAHADTRFYRDLGVEGIPMLLVVDRDGVVRYERLGYAGVGDFVEELGWRIDALRARPTRNRT